MARFQESSAEIIPLVDQDEPLSFDQFLELSVDEAESAFSQLEERNDDVAPFLTIALERSFGLVVWQALDEQLQNKFLTHVVPPVVAAQDLSMVAVVITTYMTPMTEEQREMHGSDRYEALVVAAISNRAEECAMQARIHRTSGRPQLGEFEVVADKLPPALARPLYSGLFGDLQ